MPKKKKYSKKNKSNRSFKFRWNIPFIAGAVIVVLAFFATKTYLNNKNHDYDSSLINEAAIEELQNTIPPDVMARIKEEEKVLGLSISGFNNATTLPTSVRIPIFMYHYVEYVADPGDKTRISLNITPYTLEQEIKTLKDAGYTFMTNAELTEALDGKRQLPPKPIVLTFDDGYRDFYTDVYPILKKYRAKATQYVITDFLNNPNHLTTSELQEIASDPLVEIGAHTVHHVWLKGQAASTVKYELSQSKKELEDIIHKPVVSFAYPFGAFDQQTIDAVKASGFTSAASTIPGIDQLQTNRYFLYRLRSGGRSGQYLLDWLNKVTNS